MFSKEKMERIARTYQAAESRPDNADVRDVYAVFCREVAYQFAALPVRVEFTESDPYKSSAEMFADVERGILRVYSGGNVHPLMTPEENNRFRAIHDYFGHYMTGNGFGPKGEFGAWAAHRRMFSVVAARALDTETIGQAAVYFFGGSRTFADQKAFLFPTSVIEEGQ